MNIWNQIPFFRLLLPFTAGILTAIYNAQQVQYMEYVLSGLFIVIALFTFIRRLRFSYKRSWVFGSLVTVLLFSCGFHITVLNTEIYNSNHFSKFPDADLFCIQTSSSLLEKERSFKTPAYVIAVKQKGTWIATSGKVMCYFGKDSISQNIRYGDCLVLKTKFTAIKPPQNPSEFDYKRFLSFHNIFHQTYAPSGSWIPTGMNRGNRIISISISMREYLLNIYKENNITGDEYAVGSALVLGYTDKLDEDLISAYASSGALHVLSVSGLHVGIVYIIFNYLLIFLDKFRSGRFIKMILLLLILWFYALLTGLSPSVLRSAAMFSFVVIASSRRYNINIFNTLAVSCFVLLLYSPYLLMDVGFQLSYLAVLGIVTLQPRIYELWKPNSWLADQAWIITSVSAAAQLTTFPLGLLYFHQFPNYFLLSNLIVIPVSTLILGYGLLLFILGKISAIGLPCGKLFSGLVWFLNESVRITDQAPGALTQGISISILETCLIYTLIILLCIFLYNKQVRLLFSFLATLTLLFALKALEVNTSQKQKAFIVYNIPKTSAYDFINGNQTLFLGDSSILQNKSRMAFHVKNNWWKRNIIRQELYKTEKLNVFYKSYICIRNNLIQFNNKRIAIISSALKPNLSVNQRLRVDLIVLSKNPEVKMKDLKKLYDFKTVIFDASNLEWRIRKWKQECEDTKTGFYSVPESGAYVEEI